MCTNPIKHQTPDGEVIFACRHCNDCIKARKNDWVARAMAEAQVATELFSITLTYRDNEDGSKPDGAVAFKYEHVKEYMKRVREAYHRKYGARGEISFIVAGERGSKGTQRVHWHLLIFAKRPIGVLGQWFDFVWKKIGVPRISKVGRKPKMIHTQYWDHGHVVVLEPDQAGVAYVMKYALKDQFNVVNSKGTAREAKSENHGASYFRMSKSPPIGLRYLEARCDDWEKRLTVPVSLDLRIPDYSGYWYVKGNMRDYLCHRLHHINQLRRERTGKDAPGWYTLLASAVSLNENNNDWENLVYGPEENAEETFDAFEWQDRIGSPQGKIRKRCGGIEVCRGCYAGKDAAERAAFKAWHTDQAGRFVRDTQSPPGWNLDQWFRAGRKINPFCTLKDAPDRKQAFD